MHLDLDQLRRALFGIVLGAMAPVTLYIKFSEWLCSML